uniref:C2orf72-like C-terminal domain-containing protein n=1 Tax=Pelusios castaneus TaxID=367368 RepID=A0A8C8RRH0_9SAUR
GWRKIKSLIFRLEAKQILNDFQVLLEKVGGKPEVLLVGESLEGKDTRALMAAFVQELFPDACKPEIGPVMAVPQTQPGATPGSSSSQSQLIFFLCRASSLRGKQAEIQQILREVKRFCRRAPAALVGVIMEPRKDEEAEARKLMESLLQAVFPRQPQVEVFIPGQPRGKLAIMKAACRASEALQQRTSADGMDRWGRKPGSMWEPWLEECRREMIQATGLPWANSARIRPEQWTLHLLLQKASFCSCGVYATGQETGACNGTWESCLCF